MNELTDHPDPARRWKNRRWMAWTAFAGMMGYPLLFLFVDSPHLASIATPVMGSLFAVVGSYIGFSAWESVRIGGK
jgi:hypothetical protein